MPSLFEHPATVGFKSRLDVSLYTYLYQKVTTYLVKVQLFSNWSLLCPVYYDFSLVTLAPHTNSRVNEEGKFPFAMIQIAKYISPW